MTFSATDVSKDDSAPVPVEDWLRQVSQDRELSRAVHDVIQSAIVRPELASYASAKELADAAGVNIATVTRAAQALGFAGWPELRQEIRARYLNVLTAAEVAGVHEAHSSGQPFDDTINRHVSNLTDVRKTLDRRAVRDFAKSIAGAERRMIVVFGSFAAAGRILAHNSGIAGYPSELLDDAVSTANSLAAISSRDLIVIISFWRPYRAALAAAERAKSQGARLCVISDTAMSLPAKLADHLLVVPSEGSSFFPSLLPCISVIEGICAELVAIDPQRTNAAIAEAEKQWRDFGLLQITNSSKRVGSQS